jgi:hypothetical protein
MHRLCRSYADPLPRSAVPASAAYLSISDSHLPLCALGCFRPLGSVGSASFRRRMVRHFQVAPRSSSYVIPSSLSVSCIVLWSSIPAVGVMAPSSGFS